MATVSERHPGGRPQTRPESPLFKKIKVMAKRRGIRLDELASQAGLSRTVFYTLKDPRVSTAKALADALGVTVDRLIAPPSSSRRASK